MLLLSASKELNRLHTLRTRVFQYDIPNSTAAALWFQFVFFFIPVVVLCPRYNVLVSVPCLPDGSGHLCLRRGAGR